VATHHRCDRREVGWAAGRGVEDGRDLAEVVGAEDAGGDDRERLRVDVVGVVEVMGGAAGDAERLAGGNVGRNALDRPGQDALEAVDRLLVAVVAVWGRDLRARGNLELEDRDRSCRLLALDQEANRQLSDLDLFARRVLLELNQLA
jgi:hypothetical protein